VGARQAVHQAKAHCTGWNAILLAPMMLVTVKINARIATAIQFEIGFTRSLVLLGSNSTDMATLVAMVNAHLTTTMLYR
jgi:hypothetical protein